MSRRGNCYDNAMAENFFSILKIEYISRLKPTTFAEAREDIDSYIYFYNHRSYPVKNWSGAAHAAPLRLKLNFSYHGTFLCCPYNLGQYNSVPLHQGGLVYYLLFLVSFTLRWLLLWKDRIYRKLHIVYTYLDNRSLIFTGITAPLLHRAKVAISTRSAVTV